MSDDSFSNQPSAARNKVTRRRLLSAVASVAGAAVAGACRPARGHSQLTDDLSKLVDYFTRRSSVVVPGRLDPQESLDQSAGDDQPPPLSEGRPGTQLPSPSSQEPPTMFPADLSSGAHWNLERSWSFEGAAGGPPPSPWRNGVGWANNEVDPWRQALYPNKTSGNARDPTHARLDGKGALKLSMVYDPKTKLCSTAYLITFPGGRYHEKLIDDYKATPTASGIFIEARIRFPLNKGGLTLPSCAAFGWWMFDQQASTRELHPEIDVLEYPGIDFYSDWFVSNTHGGARQNSPYEGNVGRDGGYGTYPGFGGFVRPTQHFRNRVLTDPGDGNWHTWALFWSKTDQRFYYDGHAYWTRKVGPGLAIHQSSLDLRLTIEFQENGWGVTKSRDHSFSQGEWNDDPHVLIDYVRVYRREEVANIFDKMSPVKGFSSGRSQKAIARRGLGSSAARASC